MADDDRFLQPQIQKVVTAMWVWNRDRRLKRPQIYWGRLNQPKCVKATLLPSGVACVGTVELVGIR